MPDLPGGDGNAEEGDARLRVLDLCAGREGWGAAFRERGHDYVPLELFQGSPWQMAMDVRTFARNPGGVLDALVRPGWRPHAIVAGPPCQGFSPATLGLMWDNSSGVPIPKHETAETGLTVLTGVLEAIRKLQPPYWWMENPRGMMRKMPHVANVPRVTITYCQYGETTQKPTDLWGRWPASWTPRPVCSGDPRLGTVTTPEGLVRVLDRNGRPCHVAAPRGSRTPGSTQGKVGSALRALIPLELSRDVCAALETALKVAPGMPRLLAWEPPQPARRGGQQSLGRF